MIKKTLLILSFVIFLPISSVLAADKASILESLDKIEAEHKALIPTGFAWRWTPGHILKARNAVKKGRLNRALKLTALANRQVNLAKEQIITAEKNWKIAVPK